MTTDDTSYTSLNEQAHMIKHALRFTDGDMEQARQMVAGKYDDAAVIKGKFSIEELDRYGLFIIFLNTSRRFLMNVGTLLLFNKTAVENSRVFDGWRLFYSEFVKLVKKEGDRASDSYDFSNHLADSLESCDIYSSVENWDFQGVTRSISEIIGKFYNTAKTWCQIEMEKTNSLAVDMEGIPIEQPAERKESIDEQPQGEQERRIAEIEQQAEHVIEAKIIVSPVRGRYINEVSIGDKIKVQLIKKDDISLKVAKVLNALTEEGEMLPIKGRIKEKLPLDKKGFIIYALVAKNVLAKIIEEENVKIEMDSQAIEQKPEQGEARLLIYAALLAGLFLVTIFIVYALL